MVCRSQTGDRSGSSRMTKLSILPAEIQEMIVRRCTEETRISLKATSCFNKELVEGTRLNSIHRLQIGRRCNGKLEICILRCKSRSPQYLFDPFDSCQRYETFDEFQTALTNLLESVHCIKNLTIQGISCKIASEKWDTYDYRWRMKVEKLLLIANEENPHQAASILAQIDPVYLRKIHIMSDGGESAIYDMPQVVHAEFLIAGESIREDQLFKLNARSIALSPNVPFSMLKYIEKCIQTASTKLPCFRITDENAFYEVKSLYSPTADTVLLDTSHPQLKFELNFLSFSGSSKKTIVAGGVRYKSERVASAFLNHDKSAFKVIERLLIEFRPENKDWIITIKREFHHGYSYELKIMEKVQKVLDEILENTDCIKYLTLELRVLFPHNLDKKFKKAIHWKPRKYPLMVKTLSVTGDHSITSIHDLLHQIDPVYLHNLQVDSYETENTIFDMPHLTDTSVYLVGSILTDNQLLKLKSISFVSSDKYAGHCLNKQLTSAGINQYIKKCLLDPKEEYPFFQLYNLSPMVNEAAVLEGLNILSNIPYQDKRRIVIDSAHPEFVFEVEFHKNCIIGSTINRDDVGF